MDDAEEEEEVVWSPARRRLSQLSDAAPSQPASSAVARSLFSQTSALVARKRNSEWQERENEERKRTRSNFRAAYLKRMEEIRAKRQREIAAARQQHDKGRGEVASDASGSQISASATSTTSQPHSAKVMTSPFRKSAQKAAPKEVVRSSQPNESDDSDDDSSDGDGSDRGERKEPSPPTSGSISRSPSPTSHADQSLSIYAVPPPSLPRSFSNQQEGGPASTSIAKGRTFEERDTLTPARAVAKPTDANVDPATGLRIRAKPKLPSPKSAPPSKPPGLHHFRPPVRPSFDRVQASKHSDIAHMDVSTSHESTPHSNSRKRPYATPSSREGLNHSMSSSRKRRQSQRSDDRDAFWRGDGAEDFQTPRRVEDFQTPRSRQSENSLRSYGDRRMESLRSAARENRAQASRSSSSRAGRSQRTSTGPRASQSGRKRSSPSASPVGEKPSNSGEDDLFHRTDFAGSIFTPKNDAPRRSSFPQTQNKRRRLSSSLSSSRRKSKPKEVDLSALPKRKPSADRGSSSSSRDRPRTSLSSLLSQTAISSAKRRGDRTSTSRRASGSSQSLQHPLVHTIDSPGRPHAADYEVHSHRNANKPSNKFHPNVATPQSFPQTPSDSSSRSRHGRAVTGRSTSESSRSDLTPFHTAAADHRGGVHRTHPLSESLVKSEKSTASKLSSSHNTSRKKKPAWLSSLKNTLPTPKVSTPSSVGTSTGGDVKGEFQEYIPGVTPHSSSKASRRRPKRSKNGYSRQLDQLVKRQASKQNLFRIEKAQSSTESLAALMKSDRFQIDSGVDSIVQRLFDEDHAQTPGAVHQPPFSVAHAGGGGGGATGANERLLREVPTSQTALICRILFGELQYQVYSTICACIEAEAPPESPITFYQIMFAKETMRDLALGCDAFVRLFPPWIHVKSSASTGIDLLCNTIFCVKIEDTRKEPMCAALPSEVPREVSAALQDRTCKAPFNREEALQRLISQSDSVAGEFDVVASTQGALGMTQGTQGLIRGEGGLPMKFVNLKDLQTFTSNQVSICGQVRRCFWDPRPGCHSRIFLSDTSGGFCEVLVPQPYARNWHEILSGEGEEGTHLAIESLSMCVQERHSRSYKERLHSFLSAFDFGLSIEDTSSEKRNRGWRRKGGEMDSASTSTSPRSEGGGVSSSALLRKRRKLLLKRRLVRLQVDDMTMLNVLDPSLSTGQAAARQVKHLDPVPISKLLEELSNTSPSDATSAVDGVPNAEATDQPRPVDDNVVGEDVDADVMIKPGKMEVTDSQVGAADVPPSRHNASKSAAAAIPSRSRVSLLGRVVCVVDPVRDGSLPRGFAFGVDSHCIRVHIADLNSKDDPRATHPSSSVDGETELQRSFVAISATYPYSQTLIRSRFRSNTKVFARDIEVRSSIDERSGERTVVLVADEFSQFMFPMPQSTDGDERDDRPDVIRVADAVIAERMPQSVNDADGASKIFPNLEALCRAQCIAGASLVLLAGQIEDVTQAHSIALCPACYRVNLRRNLRCKLCARTVTVCHRISVVLECGNERTLTCEVSDRHIEHLLHADFFEKNTSLTDEALSHLKSNLPHQPLSLVCEVSKRQLQALKRQLTTGGAFDEVLTAVVV